MNTRKQCAACKGPGRFEVTQCQGMNVNVFVCIDNNCSAKTEDFGSLVVFR